MADTGLGLGPHEEPRRYVVVDADNGVPIGHMPTYAVGFDLAGYVTPTDLFAIWGSSSKVIRITHINLSGHTTNGSQVDFQLIKRSTANTGGTPSAQAGCAYDRLSPAPTATVNVYGSAPTLGTAAGVIRDSQLTLPQPGANSASLLEWTFGTRNTEPLFLRGTGDGLALNFLGAALPGGFSVSVTVEWTEEIQ